MRMKAAEKTGPNRLEVLFWARRLVKAEDARKNAEREYQRVLMQLRGALGGDE